MTDADGNVSCDRCKSRRNVYYGDDVPGASYVGQDLCETCMEHYGITNCGGCGGLFKFALLDNDYYCVRCAYKRKGKPEEKAKVENPSTEEIVTATPLPAAEDVAAFFKIKVSV